MKNETELLPATRDAQPLVQDLNIENVFKYAIEHQGSAETIEKLMGVRRELRAETAKKAFDEALAAFQSECPVIEKRKAVMNKDGRSIRYKYAPLDDIVTQVKPLLLKHGLSYSLTSPTEQGRVKAVCKLKHPLGHSEESEFAVPIDPQAFMNEQQKFASALTFAKRYAFCNALGILTGDEDTDGRIEVELPHGPASATKETRQRFIAAIADIKEKALAYAIDKGLIEPNEGLEDWPLENVPVMKSELNELRKKIEAHQ